MRWRVVAGAFAFLVTAASAEPDSPFEDQLGRLPNDYTVTYFGVDGTDGVGLSADDTPAFRAALEAWAADGTASRVLVPAGEYCLHRSGSDSLHITQDGLHLVGAGVGNYASFMGGSILNLTANSAQQGARGFIVGDRADGSITRGVTIEGFVFRATTPNRLGNVVNIVNAQDVTFRRCVFATTRVSGRFGPGYYAGVLVDYTSTNPGETARINFEDCVFQAPVAGGGSAVGDALRVLCTSPVGRVSTVGGVLCSFAGAVAPGRAIMVQGACQDCGTGPVERVSFAVSSIFGSSGVEWCSASLCRFEGPIVMASASTDTAVFNQYQSADNVVVGDVVGLVVDQQSNPGDALQVIGAAADGGPIFRAVELLGWSTTSPPSITSGRYGLWIDEASGKIKVRKGTGPIKTVAYE